MNTHTQTPVPLLPQMYSSLDYEDIRFPGAEQ